MSKNYKVILPIGMMVFIYLIYHFSYTSEYTTSTIIISPDCNFERPFKIKTSTISNSKISIAGFEIRTTQLPSYVYIHIQSILSVDGRNSFSDCLTLDLFENTRIPFELAYNKQLSKMKDELRKQGISEKALSVVSIGRGVSEQRHLEMFLEKYDFKLKAIK